MFVINEFHGYNDLGYNEHPVITNLEIEVCVIVHPDESCPGKICVKDGTDSTRKSIRTCLAKHVTDMGAEKQTFKKYLTNIKTINVINPCKIHTNLFLIIFWSLYSNV